MSFDYPLVLLGCIVIIPIALYDRFSVQGKMIRRSLPKNLRVKLSLSRLFFRLFIVFSIFVLAGPRWGVGEAAGEYRRMVDTVIALDVSRSMAVPDDAVGESRMERGLSIVRDTIEAMPGTRFAVAVSRNNGIVTVPLTWDSSAALSFLDAITRTDGTFADSAITGRGTNLESLVDAAAGAFQALYPSAKVILLVSDGEALLGTLSSALDRCNRDGIAVIAIAVGSDEGGIVPGGEEYLSRRDSATMRMAAAQTGGIYIDGSRDDAARTLSAHLRSLGPEREIKGSTQERKARWFVFVFAAIMALGASNASLLRMRSE